ncbi:hypothetical protein PV417_26495, partial [Streptomyces sp. ME19-03-3]|nr:hypothetical protein [Streptomyces sp. ME19-03-3]
MHIDQILITMRPSRQMELAPMNGDFRRILKPDPIRDHISFVTRAEHHIQMDGHPRFRLTILDRDHDRPRHKVLPIVVTRTRTELETTQRTTRLTPIPPTRARDHIKNPVPTQTRDGRTRRSRRHQRRRRGDSAWPPNLVDAVDQRVTGVDGHTDQLLERVVGATGGLDQRLPLRLQGGPEICRLYRQVLGTVRLDVVEGDGRQALPGIRVVRQHLRVVQLEV